MDVRRVTVATHHTAPDLLENVCKILKKRNRLAAVRSSLLEKPEILVASLYPVSGITMEGEDWQVELKDRGSCRLSFSQSRDVELLAQLMERSILLEIERQTDFWTLDSPRIWYSPTAFQEERDISAFRRFHASVIPVESEGLGVVIHISTAFFTNLSVADYFEGDSSSRFDFLRQRQKGQKGTLLYDLGKSKSKCYFEEFLDDEICNRTRPIKVNGKTYPSLYEYCRQKHPKVSINQNDPVASVSFRNLPGRQLVPANKLRLRVFNQALPKELKQVDKIPPLERTKLIEEFWSKLDGKPFGRGKPGINKQLWCPSKDKLIYIPPPPLEFGKEKILDAPVERNINSYRKYYNDRQRLLDKYGCYYVPHTIERTVHFAVPDKAPEEMAERIAKDISDRISKWTKRDIMYENIPYSTIEDAFSKLREEGSGMVVFIFEDDEPATYYDVSYNLANWRIKRITQSQLETHFNSLVKAEATWKKEEEAPPKGIRDWRSFVQMSALDVLQQLECIPWIPATPLNYEAQLAIDVSEKRRYFALSLFICRNKHKKPAVRIRTVVRHKSDPQHETINKIELQDAMIKLFKSISQSKIDPISSLLVPRDGRKCGNEMDAIRDASQSLISLGLLEKNATIHIVDFHKKSQKEVRMWERGYNSRVENLPGGTGIILDNRTVVLANTGIATLQQGTASPIMLVANGDDVDMIPVAEDIFVSAQLNYSKPNVAQRLPLTFKRTDDELKNKAAQEIKSMR